MELKEDVLQYLGEGYRVELGEFGFFSAKVKASRLVANKNDIRSESVAFSSIRIPSITPSLNPVLLATPRINRSAGIVPL